MNLNLVWAFIGLIAITFAVRQVEVIRVRNRLMQLESEIEYYMMLNTALEERRVYRENCKRETRAGYARGSTVHPHKGWKGPVAVGDTPALFHFSQILLREPPVERTGGFLVRAVSQSNYFNSNQSGAKPYLQHVANLNTGRGLGGPPVLGYMSTIAQFLCKGSALYQARNLKILIQPHCKPSSGNSFEK
jgi:hypothetical protein